jgi:tetratricopeptide (TPR) repeat protein
MGSLRLLFRTGLTLACLALLLLATCRARALQENAIASATLERRIADDEGLIKSSELTEIDQRSLGRLWARLALDYEDAGKFSEAEAAYNRSLQIFEHAPDGMKDFGLSLENLGSLYLAMRKPDEAEKCRRRAQATFESIGDKRSIAWGEALLAEVYLGKHKFKEAQRMATEAYDAMVALEENDASLRVSALITVIYASCMHGQCAYAVDRGLEAKQLVLSAFPADSLLVAEVRAALGYAAWKTGMNDAADEEMRESIRILKVKTTPGHPYLLGAMAQYQSYLKEMHRTAEADEIAKQEQALRKGTTTGCLNCTVSVYSLR